MSRYCHPHFVPASTLNPTAALCPVLRKTVVQLTGGAMLRLCRPVHGFVRYYGTVRPYDQYQGAPTSSDAMPRPVLRRPVLWPILRAAVSSTMVTSGLATTTSHSTMSRLRSILWLWSDPVGVPGSMAPSYHVVLHYGSMVWRHSILCRHGSAASSTTVLWICGMSGPIVCLDLWYVWSDLMSGSMVCMVYPSTMVCVVCLVLSYAGQSYDGMVCVAYPASPSTMVCVVCLVLSYAG
jgi:hypothetical protein